MTMGPSFVAGLMLQLLVLLQKQGISAEDISVTVSKTTFVGETGKISSSPAMDKSYAKFLGIRFGDPPMGNKRFQKPTMYKYQQPTVNTTQFGNVCYQLRQGNTLISDNDTMSEDCLFLNIFVPIGTTTNSTLPKPKEKKAVYIFIHGGSYLRGSADLYGGTKLACEGDIIVVTINYRLGVLGFLTTDNDVIPANLGLWDQDLAIKWVSLNIEAFGGDPTRITVGGESAGAFSSVLQSFYEFSIFHRTISESGTPLARNVVAEKGFPAAVSYANAAGCSSASPNDIRDCFKDKPAADIVKLRVMPTSATATAGVGPTLDRDFISEATYNLFPTRIEAFKIPDNIPQVFSGKPLLIGSNSEDGSIVYELIKHTVAAFSGVKNTTVINSAEFAKKILPVLVWNSLSKNFVKGSTVMAAAINEFYTDWTQASDNDAYAMSVVHFMTDSVFKVPSINTAMIHSAKNLNVKKTFVYEFSLPPGLDPSNDLKWFNGTRHGTELAFLFDFPIGELLPNLSKAMRMYWANFIKSGDPNPTGTSAWKEYNKDTGNIFRLGGNGVTESVPMAYAKDVHFCNQYIPALDKSLSALYEEGKKSANGSGSMLKKDVSGLVLFVASIAVIFSIRQK